MFWVISVYFNLRNTLPKFGTFLLGHLYIYIYVTIVRTTATGWEPVWGKYRIIYRRTQVQSISDLVCANIEVLMFYTDAVMVVYNEFIVKSCVWDLHCIYRRHVCFLPDVCYVKVKTCVGHVILIVLKKKFRLCLLRSRWLDCQASFRPPWRALPNVR